MSSIELLTTFVESEFKDYIAVPCLANASDYELLSLLFVDTGKKSLKDYILSTVVSGKKADLTNAGPLGLFTSAKQEVLVAELINEAKVEKIGIYDPTITSRKDNLKFGVDYIKSWICYNQSSQSGKFINLGLITKKKIPYQKIADMLCKLSSFTEAIRKLGRKKSHLFIIHEVIYAEKIEVLQFHSKKGKAKTAVGIGSCSTRKPLSDVEPNIRIPVQNSGIGGSLFVGKEVENATALSRPEDFGRFPIGYKCGKIRVIYKKKKLKLKLAQLSTFYKPFDSTDQSLQNPTTNEASSSCKYSSGGVDDYDNDNYGI